MDRKFLLKMPIVEERDVIYRKYHILQKRKMVCARPMRIRIDAIQRLKPPTTPE